jgi:hypothetical protein
MRSLETAAQAGVVIVAALAGIIVTEAALDGFPAVRDGELPLWGLKVTRLDNMPLSSSTIFRVMLYNKFCLAKWSGG